MVLLAPVSVDIATLARVVGQAGLGDPHIVLVPTAAWLPRVAERAAEDAAREAGVRLGWLDRRGELDVEVGAALRVLCQANVELYGWIDDGDRIVGVLCAKIGTEALLAVRAGNTVWLTQIRPTVLADALAAQTPDVPPGTGRPVRALRAEVAATSPRDGRVRTATGTLRQPASADARKIRLLTELPAAGGGELRVAVRDHLGRRMAGPALHYVDTRQGRYRTVGGDPYVEVIPVSRDDLAGWLREEWRRLTAPSR